MKLSLLILALTLAYGIASAEVRLPGVISDGMVLQRNDTVSLWGWTEPKSKLVVRTSWDAASYRTVADDEGCWTIDVITSDAGGPYEISFDDGDRLVVKDILLGEVWICSGQSNMEMPMGGYIHQPVRGAAEYVMEACSYPQIRLLTVPRVGKSGAESSPYGQMPYEWKISAPESVRNFSAIGYMFGRRLTDCLGGVPVGVISMNWGGSDVAAWISHDALKNTQDVDLEAACAGTEDNTAPASLYENMLLPLAPFTSKGILWYQGESNRYNWFDYKNLLVSMVRCWRQTWHDEDMYFYQVQLAPHGYDGDSYRSIGLMNEAQYEAALEIPYSGVVASVDVGEHDCIHASEKKVLADRLSWLALADVYGIPGFPMPAPVYKSMSIAADQSRGKVAVLEFDNLSDVWNESDSFYMFDAGYVRVPKGFEIAGEDKIFHRAEARFLWGNRIEVWSEEVLEPVAVRYAFANWCPEANVVTTQGQPLMPFRTDDWPVNDAFENNSNR